MTTSISRTNPPTTTAPAHHPLPEGPDNPAGNGYYARLTLLKTEHEAQRFIDPPRGRYWKIVNPHCRPTSHNAWARPPSVAQKG